MYMYNIIALYGLSMINIKSILSQYYNYVYKLYYVTYYTVLTNNNTASTLTKRYYAVY